MKLEDINALVENLQREWPIVEIVSFNELNIQEKLENLPYQIIRFGEQFIKEKAKLAELNNMKTRLECKLYDKLKFNDARSLTKQEIVLYYLPNDVNVKKIVEAIDKQTVIVEYFETCTKALDKMNWTIKIYIDDRKYNG